MTNPKEHVQELAGFDGSRIHVTSMGDGPPVLLLHGLFSSAHTNWIRYGTARRIAEAGFRLLMPDFRGHGQSESPNTPDAWPVDVLSMDIEALLPQLGLGKDFILGGYSLGARTVARLLARGMRPSATIFAGMGLAGLTAATRRNEWFIRLIEGRGNWPRGSEEFRAEAFMNANVGAPEAILWLLRNQLDTPLETLRGFNQPALVVAGAEDHDNGSATELAAELPYGRYREIPGTHMGSVIRPELGEEIAAYLRQVAA